MVGITSKKVPSRPSSGGDPLSMIGFACMDHPRQGHRSNGIKDIPKQPPRQASIGATRELRVAVEAIRKHVASEDVAAQEALKDLNKALEVLEHEQKTPKRLTARYNLVVTQRTPEVEPIPGYRLFRSTYQANAPSEDRSTVVVGDDFFFCGVWDGHGGYQCAEYTQNNIFVAFCEAFESGAPVPEAFKQAYKKTDRDYYDFSRSLNDPAYFFAGSCAVACYLDVNTKKLWCANLGDSRGVMGVFREKRLHTVRISVDHTAGNLIEQQRLRGLHPHDPEVLVDMSEYYEDDTGWTGDPDWRVKKVAAFTRSIGDLHLKEKNTSALFNSYVPSQRILPRPGTVNKQGRVVPSYISTEPEIKEVLANEPGFLIVACDGVWDEMTSEEAVQCVAKLFGEYDAASTNIADLFIEKVLERAVERIRYSYEEESELTLEELKKRPVGKDTDSHRALLHDDITVVIVQLGTNQMHYRGRLRFPRGQNDDMGGSSSGMSTGSGYSKLKLQASLRSLDPMNTLEDELKRHAGDPDRQETDRQIVEMMDFFAGMNTRHLKILFNALDVDGNGDLDREEIGRLINQVMLTDVSPTVVDVAFSEMDDDGSGAVDFTEFVAFFGHCEK